MSEQAGRVRFAALDALPVTDIAKDQIIAQDGAPIRFSVSDNMTSIRDARLTYIDAARDYQIASVSARNELAETVRISDMQVPLMMDIGQANSIVENRLNRSEPARRSASVSMPVARAPGAGAVVRLPGVDGLWQVERVRLGLQADLDLVALPRR